MSSTHLPDLYHNSLTLLTDLYQLTMAYAYWKCGIADKVSAFHLFFRNKPFKGDYAIAAGLQMAIEFIENFRFDQTDLDYLSTLKAGDGSELFEKAFLDYLSEFSFDLDIDAVEEGTAVFPHEPLLRVTGPILQAQLLESPLLNIINFQTLIATKASRVCRAAAPDEVIEFGLRRAQGVDGALSASRAAFIGGCRSTSNVLAGKYYGIPIKGTHAHSWVMAFEKEERAFQAYAEAMPSNTVFLIDTYDSIEGAKKAIEVAKQLQKQKDFHMLGVRLDSGDLAQLSIQIRKMLDENGLKEAKIMASSELDEYLIRDLKQQGTKVTIWGVGTHLVTGEGQPALGGVYKLSGIQNEKGQWEYKLKISEQMIKVTNPGIMQIRRFRKEGQYVGDMIFDDQYGPGEEFVDPVDPVRHKKKEKEWEQEDLLVPIFRKGKKVYQSPSLQLMQEKAKKELKSFPPGVLRFLYPSPYFVGLEKKLFEKKLSLIEEYEKKS